MKYPTTSKTLIDRLQDGDDVTWDEFYSLYAPIVQSLGRLKGLAPVECEELVQAVMLRFFNHSGTFVFRPDEARFRTYFGRIVQWCIVDLFRARQPQLSEDAIPLLCREPRQPDRILNEGLLAEWHRMLLREALAELRTRVELQTYSAFELYALQHKSAAEVALLLGMNTAKIYLAKSRCLAILNEIFHRFSKDDPELRALLNEH